MWERHERGLPPESLERIAFILHHQLRRGAAAAVTACDWDASEEPKERCNAARPSQWAATDTPFDVDVRFRLHRFGAHLVEHTQQVDKTLRQLGQAETDAQAYVRQISIIRGRHERRSPEGVRKRLDEQITAVAEAAGS